MDQSTIKERRPSPLDLQNRPCKRQKLSSMELSFYEARCTTSYEVSLDIISSIKLTAEKSFLNNNVPVNTTTILSHNVQVFESDQDDDDICKNNQGIVRNSLISCYYMKPSINNHVKVNQNKILANDMRIAAIQKDPVKLSLSSGNCVLCEEPSCPNTIIHTTNETTIDSIVARSGSRPVDSLFVQFYDLLSSSMHEKYGHNKSYRPKVLFQFVQQIITDISIKQSVLLLSDEWMLSIKMIRSNSIYHASLIFKAGIKLHDSGFVHSAMYLYEEFLDRLIYINNHASSLGNSSSSNNNNMHNSQKNLKTSLLDSTIQEGRESSTMVQSLYEASMNTFLGIYPRMASTLKKLGSLHLQMNDYHMALHYFNAGIRVDEVLLHVCYSNIVETLMNIALIHRRAGNYTLALTKYIQVYFLQLRAYGPNSIQVATSLSMIAFMQYRLKQYSSAFELYQESLTIQRDILGENNIGVASTINSLGLCCFYLRIFNHAKTFFMHSLKIRRKIFGINHYDLAIIWYNVATICVEMKEEIEAIRCYKESLRIEMIELDYNKCDGAILTLQNLGYIYQQNGEIDEACIFFKNALELQKKKISGNGTEIIGKLYNLIGNIHLQKAEVKDMMDCYIAAARSYQRGKDRNETMVISGYTFYSLSKLHPQCAHVA